MAITKTDYSKGSLLILRGRNLTHHLTRNEDYSYWIFNFFNYSVFFINLKSNITLNITNKSDSDGIS